MKKFITTLALTLCTILCNAEVFVGGLFGVSYSEEFEMTVLPSAGYQFNDYFALGAGVGVTVVNEPYGVVNPFISFTPCQNDRAAFDIVVQSEIIFIDSSPLSMSGVAPCLRMKLSDNLELLTDLGIFGITAYEGEVSPALAIKNLNVGATINYIIPKKEKK